MWEHNLNSLNPGEFANLLKYREDKIAAAAGKGKREERQINKLSKSLHPKRQELRVAEVIEQAISLSLTQRGGQPAARIFRQGSIFLYLST